MHKSFTYHDSTLENISLDFEEQSITFTIQLFDEDIDDYFKHYIKFQKVKKLSLPIESITQMEVNSFDIMTSGETSVFEGVINTGFGAPELVISFQFNYYELKEVKKYPINYII